MPKLTKRSADAAKPTAKPSFVWDDALKGFGLLVAPSGSKSFIVQYRTETGRSRRLTLGRYGPLTPDQARTMALETLGAVRTGADPLANKQAARRASTMNDLLDRYLTHHVEVHNAPRTQESVKKLVTRIIRPRLGTLKAAAVTRQDISKLHHALIATPRQANIVLAVLSKAFNLAEAWGMRPEQSNPVRMVKRYKENERERFLSMDELGRLGQSLELAGREGLPWVITANGLTRKHVPKDAKNRHTPVNAMALTAIRLLLYTGARLSEILELRWSHVDLENGTVALPSRKGDGRRAHPVNSAALGILAKLANDKQSEFVLPRESDPQRHVSKEVVESAWRRLRGHANLRDVRLHDLRHTVGTFASQAGSNSFLISHLLRHKSVTITNRYVNHDANPIREVSERIGERIEAGLRGAAVVVDAEASPDGTSKTANQSHG